MLFSTDSATVRLGCAAHQENSILDNEFVGDTSCSTWQGNSVDSWPQPGYGPGLAFPPEALWFSWPEQRSYASNASNKLALHITVTDQANTQVTPGVTACAR